MPKITQVPSIPVPSMPDPAEIRWRDWGLGRNVEDDPIDLPLGACADIYNLDIDSKGKVKDIYGYTNALSNYPASLSISRIFQYKVTKPSAQTITIVIGTLSGLWKVYAVNATLFNRPGDVSGWRDLTEYISTDTLTGTGTTTTIVDLGALSKTANAQKGYFLINLTTGVSSIVTASSYSAGEWTLTSANSMGAGAGAADTVLLMRYPLIGYYATGTVTDYDLSVTDADDISFSLDNDDLRINFGSAGDQERGFWFGYIDRFNVFAQGSYALNDVTNNYAAYNTGGWYCENQDLLRATAESLTATAPAATATYTALPVDTYYFKVSFMYDGHQEGPPNAFASATQSQAVAASQYLLLSLPMRMYAHSLGGTITDESLYVQGGNMSGAPMFQSFRITDVLYYVSNDKINFYLVQNASITSDSVTLGGTAPSVAISINGAIGADQWNGRGGEYSDRTGFGSFPIADATTAYNGIGTIPKCVGFTSVQTMVRGRRFVGSIRQQTDDNYDQYVYRIAGAQAHSNGTWQNDVFGLSLSQHIDIRTKQADRVMGLEELNGGLLILKDNSLHMIDFGGGRMESWRISMSNEDIGAVSRAGVIRVPKGVVFASKNNIYLTDGINTQPLANSWKTEYRSISLANKQNIVISYYPDRDQIYVLVPGLGKLYVMSMTTGAWKRETYLTDVETLAGLLATPDGNNIVFTTGNAYLLDQSTSTFAIQGAIKTSVKELDPGWVWKLKKVFLVHKGTNSSISVILYKNNGSVAAETLTFAGSATLTSAGKRLSSEIDNIQALITTESNNNYDTEIHELMVIAVPVRRRRAAV